MESAAPIWEIKLDVWKPLEAEEAEFLEQLHNSNETTGRHRSRGQEYVFDVSQMTQTNATSGKVRQLRRRVPRPPPGIDTEGTNAVGMASNSPARGMEQELRDVVEVWLAGEWKRLTPSESNAIISQKKDGKTVFETQSRGTSYRVDLKHMTQTNLKSNRTRTIRIADRYATPDMDFDVFREAFRQRAPEIAVGVSGLKKPPTLNKDALKRSWPVDDADGEFLDRTIDRVLQDMDLRRGGQVDMTSWMHYWALERDNPSYHSAVEVNTQLEQAVKRDPQVLGRMQMHFETAVAESGKGAEVHGLSTQGLLNVCERLVASPQDVLEKQWARELLKQHEEGADVLEEDEVLSYFDFLNVMLGRKRYKVTLWMYDISKGAAERWSWLLLGQSFKGIWHTGVVVDWPERSSEFWFGGSLFESKPGTTPFGEPVEKRFLGFTYKKRQDAWDYVSRHCAAEFTRDNYDVLTHNCNHFSDKLHMFLRNEHIPDEIRFQPDMVMDTITVKAIRPLLNKWLGGFEGSDGRATDGGEEQMHLWNSLSPGALVVFCATQGGRPLVGQVIGLEAKKKTCIVNRLDFWQQCAVEHQVPLTHVTQMLRPGTGELFEPAVVRQNTTVFTSTWCWLVPS
eukprot:TRINITY_DN41438_c0_g1_i1.p1 TRINITY_DN41438_c0_g1~~TRINITY_DN41438_c0_g1_i1.p1  ORF type:complete len:623 (+),score=117.78 TRINITY_DN41438_c0_g1_i1:103-1971(+)